MKQDIKITGIQGFFSMPIYNFKDISTIHSNISEDLKEVKEEISERMLLNKNIDGGLAFQHAALSSIKEGYKEIILSVCN
jgi:hypothetical protein